MSGTGWLWSVINWASLPMMAVIAGILVWRRLHREFPFFFSFLIVTELVGLLRLATAHFGSGRNYFYVYWVSDFVLDFVILLSIYELFLLRLFPRFYRTRVYRYLFGITAAVIAAGAWRAAAASPNINAAFATLSRVLYFSIVAILIFFGLLMVTMGRRWTKQGFGIAFGFALNNAAVLITSAVWVRNRYQASIVDELPVVAFDLSCLIWLYCFWSASEIVAGPRSAELNPEMLQQARGWEQQLKSWLAPRKDKG